MRTNQKTITLATGAACLALAMVLTYVKIKIGAQGGSVNFAMIPLIVFAVYKGGFGWGTLAGVAFGLLHFIFANESFLNWQSMILDYIAAFGVIGVAGLFRAERLGLKAYFFAACAACLARFLVHFISGVTVYLDYFQTEYYGISTPAPWVYSLVYNGIYMLFNTIAAMIITPIIGSVLIRTGKRQAKA